MITNQQIEMQAEDDGCRNEFQRAMALSQMEQPLVRDGRELANKLVSEGNHVSVSLTPRHCRYTDAVIGEHVTVFFADRSRQVVVDKGFPARQPDSDECWQIWPLAVPAPVQVETSDVPF